MGLILALTGACADTASGPDQAYIQALSGALDRPVTVVREVLADFPRRRALRIPPPEMTIDFIEFAKLHACDLGALVGARNSALGRVQTDSVRLVYELKWLDRAQSCENQPFLQPLLLEKRESLPIFVWNATLAGPEFAAAMANAGSEQEDWHGQTISAEPMVALSRFLTRALAGAVLERDFEWSLQALRYMRIGQRRVAWARTREALLAAADSLAFREPPVCLSGQANVRSRRVLQVFLRRYVQDWQVQLAEQMREDVEWLHAMETSYEALGAVVPLPFANFYDEVFNVNNPASEWRRTKQALVVHARAWEQFHSQCGLQVGGQKFRESR